MKVCEAQFKYIRIRKTLGEEEGGINQWKKINKNRFDEWNIV